MLREGGIGETVRCHQDEFRIDRLWRRQEQRLDQMKVRYGEPHSEEREDAEHARGKAAALSRHAKRVTGLDGPLGENARTAARPLRRFDRGVGSHRYITVR